MLSIAKLKYLRIAPRKVRLVADLIRGEKVGEAQVILDYTRKKAAVPILKLLNQAISNAKGKDSKIDEKNLYISKILVDEGPRLKRTLPRARGRADVIHKKTSHLTIVLDQIRGKPIKAGKKTKKRKSVSKTSRERVRKMKDRQRVEKKVKEEKGPKKVKKRMKWRPEKKQIKPKTKGGLKKIFRRKAI